MFGKKPSQLKSKNVKLQIPVILGPTSSGKTSLAIQFCKKHNASIISADSRQVYKYMDIGTGKIPANLGVKVTKEGGVWLVDGVEVFGYDLTTPDKYFSGYDFATFALEKKRELVQQGKNFVIVGGTGFYIDLITGRQKLDSAAPDFELRKELETKTLEELLKSLHQLDPHSYEKIDKSNRARVLRGVEKNLSQNKLTPLKLLEDVKYQFFGLDARREYLYEKVDAWLDLVWKNGLLEETKYLSKKFPGNMLLNGLVYKSAKEFIEGTKDEKTASQEAKWDLHAYIRRQLTWFRKNQQIRWLDIAEKSTNQCIMEIEKVWTKI